MTLVLRALPASLAPLADREWIDEVGGAALRCCLRHSHPGEPVALVSVTPPGPAGAYQETGPVFVHARGCDGPTSSTYPDDFRRRAQIFRTYDASGAITGGELVEAGRTQEAVAERLFEDPSVEFIHTRCVIYGCYMLMIRRG